MSELDTRLDQAARDLRQVVERFELARLPERRRRTAACGLLVAAATVTVAVVVGMTILLGRNDASPGHSAADGTTAVRADDQLAADVIDIASVHGWEVTVGDGGDSHQSYATESGVGYVEVRARVGDSSDTLLVSIRVNDRETVAAGSDGRAGLIRTVGTARVYVGTDSRSVRAVELFNDTTIVYVRFESGADAAPSLEELTDVVVAVDDIWRTRNVVYPPPASEVELPGSTLAEHDG